MPAVGGLWLAAGLALAVPGAAEKQGADGSVPAAEVLSDASALLSSRKPEEAVKILKDLVERDPKNLRAWELLGRAYGEADKLDEALAACNQALALNPRSKAALFSRYYAYYFQGNYDKAMEDATTLSELDPRDVLYVFFRVRVEVKKKDFDAALRDCDRAEALKGDQTEVLEERALAFRAAGAYPEAIEELGKWIALSPRRASAYSARGRCFSLMGKYPEAIADLEKTLTLAPDDAVSLNNLAWIFATCPDEKLLNGTRALELAGKACGLVGWKSLVEIDTLAAASARTGDFVKAVEWEKRAIELCPSEKKKQDCTERLELYQKGQAYIEPLRDKEKAVWAAKRSECFQAVWQTVNENYFDPSFGGVDWVAIREKYRARLWRAADNRALRRLLQEMLDELHRTHFEIVPREMSVLSPEERGRIGYTGAEAAVVEERVTVVRVKPDSPAAKAGLRCGDVVRGVDGHTLEEIEKSMSDSVSAPRKRQLYMRGLVNWWFSAPVGTEVRLTLEDPEGKTREVTVKTVPFDGVWSEAVGFAPSEPMDMETVRSANGVVYLRFNMFALPAMTEFKRCIRSLAPTDRLIIDLRGNPGGMTLMAPGMFGRLSGKEFSLGTMHRRDGSEDFVAYPQRGAFRGPVAVLIDAASASTSEILAAGLKEAGRARLFGGATAGAALPSMFRKLPTGDMLQYVVADIKTSKGVLIEGNGIAPDEPVDLSRADCVAGRDPVRAEAERWLMSQDTSATEGGQGR